MLAPFAWVCCCLVCCCLVAWVCQIALSLLPLHYCMVTWVCCCLGLPLRLGLLGCTGSAAACFCPCSTIQLLCLLSSHLSSCLPSGHLGSRLMVSLVTSLDVRSQIPTTCPCPCSSGTQSLDFPPLIPLFTHLLFSFSLLPPSVSSPSAPSYSLHLLPLLLYLVGYPFLPTIQLCLHHCYHHL